MGKRQRDWARRAYDQLIIDLGGKCAECGKLEALTIDHINGCCYDHEYYEWSHRISIYRREAKEGKLQVLCEKCNRAKGRPVERPDDDGQYSLFTQPPQGNDPF